MNNMELLESLRHHRLALLPRQHDVYLINFKRAPRLLDHVGLRR